MTDDQLTQAERDDLARLNRDTWAEVDKAITVEMPPLRDDDVTVARYAEKHDITNDRARKILEAQVGISLVRITCVRRHTGGTVFVYRKKE